MLSLPVLAVLAVFGLRRWFGAYLGETQAAAAALGAFGAWAPLVYIGLYTLRPLALIPATLFALVAGFLWGPGPALVYTLVGAVSSAALAFGLARLLGRRWVEQRLRGRMRDLDRLAYEQSFRVTLSLRLVLGLPFDIVSYAAGLSGTRPGPFLLATLIGVTPGAASVVLLGGSLGQVSPWAAVGGGALLLALAAAPWLLRPRPPTR